MKLGIVGKGGVGKTTVSALISQAYAARGARVVAIDTDSNPNLGMSLGMDWDEMEAVPVMPRALIVGSEGDLTAQEVIEKYGRPTPAGPVLLSAIRVTQAGSGCTCSGHATVRNFLGEVLAEEADVTLIDMEAGLEHLSRSGGTLAYADVLLVVMEPSRKSVITAARTLALAEELGIPRVYGLGNKARMPEDAEFFAELAAEYNVPLAGVIPLDPAVADADRAGSAVTATPPEAVRAALDAVIDLIEGSSVSDQAPVR
ncbi:MAG TPA: AAA family ATPase [Egibacteraceae bacterium]|jgi:CO dehydrogenase maturation factor|nr:AAA family ATPase [Egibacteraceae bacterium]